MKFKTESLKLALASLMEGRSQGCPTDKLQGKPELSAPRAREEGKLAIMSTFFYWVEEKSKDVTSFL